MIPSNVQAGYTPTHQWISFVEGSSSEAPNPENYAVTVLSSDDTLNTLDGGDPTDGFAPWVNDVLVYPSSEYWETLLHEGRVRPYFDLSIANYNTLRIPSAVHNYDLYVDSAEIYEDVNIGGGITLVAGIVSTNFSIASSGDAQFENIIGVASTRAPILTITDDLVFDNLQTGTIINSKPTGANLNITLPDLGEDGVYFTVMNCVAGATTTMVGGLLGRGNVLGEEYSSCTIYWGGDSWYGIGDLV